ncbi:hypothetical protein [Flavobacterium sp. DSR3-2]|uniref:hypothetical protein n=1 Tax=Flavobacterium sp. DSR3-2 TaxID=2804634 RepID=UPI003CF49171
MGTDYKSALSDIELIFSAYINLIDSYLFRQYLKVLALSFEVLTPVFNAFYRLF